MRLEPTGAVTFVPNASAPTRARFSAPGTYELELVASDGQLSASDVMVVNVTVAPLEVRVAAGSDDAEEARSGSMSLTGNDLELVQDDDTRQTVGVRFRNLAIPEGAVITRAWVQFKADETQSGGTRLVIRAHNVDSAPAFTTSIRNITLRAQTPDSVVWLPDPWTSVGAGPAPAWGFADDWPGGPGPGQWAPGRWRI